MTDNVCAISQFLKSTRPIAVKYDIGVRQQLLEYDTIIRLVKISIVGPLGHVAIDLEEGNIG